MKGEIKYGNRNNEYCIANANAKNILVTNEDERGVNNNKLFQSTVAPTKQFSNSTPNIIYNTTGGITQSLIINNGNTNLWVKSVAPIETITPNSLPQIGN